MIDPDDLCKEQVRDKGFTFPHYHQCYKRHVKDGYCALHHPDAVAARKAERERKHEVNNPWKRYANAMLTIASLRAEVKALKEELHLAKIKRIQR